MKLLEQQTAIITGGAQGIGFAIAQTFAQQGANLVIADIQLEQASLQRLPMWCFFSPVTSPVI